MQNKKWQHVVFALWVAAASMAGGCASAPTSTTKQTEPLPKERTNLPLPRKGKRWGAFDVPERWHVTATGPRAGSEVDYLLGADEGTKGVSIALTVYSPGRQPRTQHWLAKDYLEGLNEMVDKRITMRLFGATEGRGDGLELYLYHSEYLCYRVATFPTLADGGYVQVELYAPTEEAMQRHVGSLKAVAGSVRVW